MLKLLNQLDRRWIFLLMLIAVGLPVLLGLTPPEKPLPAVKRVFDTLEELPEGSTILVALDYDPPSAAELEPMADSFIRHCCLKRHKIILITLWNTGVPLLDKHIQRVVVSEFQNAGLKYGEDYVNLGYRPGLEVAIKQIATDFRSSFSKDVHDTPIEELPLMKPIHHLKDVKMILQVSSGFPGTKEWIQYATTTHGIPIAGGCTGVQAPQLFPYMPDQLLGLLAALKGAAEYEALLAEKYEACRNPKVQTARRRMGPQLWAHLLIIGLIVLGNGVHLANRFAGETTGEAEA